MFIKGIHDSFLLFYMVIKYNMKMKGTFKDIKVDHHLLYLYIFKAMG